MAEWKNISCDKLDPTFAAIRSLFLDGTINKMYKLIDYNPTKVARLFSMSYKTYHEKLKQPWKFSSFHIMILARITGIDPEVINKIIQEEALTTLDKGIEAYKLKEQKFKELSVKKTVKKK